MRFTSLGQVFKKLYENVMCQWRSVIGGCLVPFFGFVETCGYTRLQRVVFTQYAKNCTPQGCTIAYGYIHPLTDCAYS
jgi:hypothetical protein